MRCIQTVDRIVSRRAVIDQAFGNGDVKSPIVGCRGAETGNTAKDVLLGRQLGPGGTGSVRGLMPPYLRQRELEILGRHAAAAAIAAIRRPVGSGGHKSCPPQNRNHDCRNSNTVHGLLLSQYRTSIRLCRFGLPMSACPTAFHGAYDDTLLARIEDTCYQKGTAQGCQARDAP